jgi:hypothetical protein
MRVLLAVVLGACRPGGAPPATEPGESQGAVRSWGFDEGAPVFSAAVGQWSVAADPEAPSPPRILAQEATSDAAVYNLALLQGTSFGDLELGVKLKAIAGEIDQGGGLVWRARDARNYYVARWNPLEGNFRVYKVVEGVRTQLGTAEVPAEAGWRALRVRMRGDDIECELDGRTWLHARDATFREPGAVGLWTKADARTRFDDLVARELGG